MRIGPLICDPRRSYAGPRAASTARRGEP